jgi:hypothetical protein
MTNHVGIFLSRLIKERAYTAGHCVLLRSRLDKLKKEVSQCAKEIKRANAKITDLDKKITAASAIDTSKIRPIRSTPRILDSKHGAFRRELIRILQEADGPVLIKDILNHMATVFDLPMSTNAERRRSLELVRRPLNIFKTKGAVLRLPSHPGSPEGVWCWTDNYVDKPDHGA